MTRNDSTNSVLRIEQVIAQAIAAPPK